MVHKWILTLSLAALAIPFDAGALGLGDINVRSALNQPFNAEIELLSARPDELDSLSVTLASSNSFAQAGLDRPPILTQLRFQVEKKANGKPYLHVYTQEPIKEPFLNYLVEVNWSSGHLLREYTVLLDPPVGLVAELPTVQAPTASSSKTAPSQRSSKSLFESSPVQQSKPKTVSTVKARQPSAQIKTTADGSSYGPTQTGEGLWGIAKSLLSGDNSADVNQMMLALLKANPEAFINSNINTMKSGYVLRVPEPNEVTALSRQEAFSLVNQQTAIWKDPGYRVALKTPVPLDITTAKPGSAPKSDEAAPSSDTTSSSAQLKLVPVTDTAAEVTTPDNAEQVIAAEKQAISGEPTNSLDAAQAADIEKSRLETLSKDLTLATESLEAKRLENEELSSRLAELQTQTESVQRLIDLKSEEIAALQQPAAGSENPSAAAAASVGTNEAQPLGASSARASATQPDTVVDKAKNIADSGFASLRNIVGELSRNPMAQGITALVALLLVSLLWIIKRRRPINTQIIENPGLANAMGMSIPAVIHTSVAQPDLTALIDTDLKNESLPQPENKVEEAATDPGDRHEVQLKLLDIYHLTNSKSAFATQAEALHADLAGKGGALWDKVVVMGREICPEHPLFAGGEQARTDEYNDLPVFTTDGSTELAGNDAAQDVSVETDLDTSFWKSEDTQTVSNSIEFEFTPAEAPSSSVSEPELPEALASYDLVAAQYEMEIAALDQAAEPAPEPEAKVPGTDFNPDYKFDFDLEKEADFLAKANAELVTPTDGQFSDGLEFDSGLVINNDEVSTKLELARAYIEMGDPEGAQSILDEVMKEGDEDQKQEAQALMQKAG